MEPGFGSAETPLDGGPPEDSLFLLLNDKSDNNSQHYQEKKFLSITAIENWLTRDRIEKWVKRHPLHREGATGSFNDTHLIDKICDKSSHLVFVALVLAHLERHTAGLVGQSLTNSTLFDYQDFKKACKGAGLTNQEEDKLAESRSRIGVVLEDSRLLHLPRDCILPYHTREWIGAGSTATIYKVTVAPGHIKNYNQRIIADRQIRADSDLSASQWKQCEREVETLQRRRHDSIIRLLGSYYLETKDSNWNRTLHLIFPLAEMDLRSWMTSATKPISVEQYYQPYIYRSICELAAGLCYLHTAQAGISTSHHDLKPANILLIDGRFQIGDFDRSHLRDIAQGSATEEGKYIGTPEYQPPEYWRADGTRAAISHGRAFDVWALGCIFIELATLVVYGWNPKAPGDLTYQPVLDFGERRLNNLGKVALSSDTPQPGDKSFWNNFNVVEDWVEQLKGDTRDMSVMRLLNTALGMTVSDPRDRMHMWEVELDLLSDLRQYQAPRKDGKRVFTAGPSTPASNHKWYFPINTGRNNGIESWKLSAVKNNCSTPLHRGAKSGDKSKVVRLWSLGWPIFVADSRGDTPLTLMGKSDNSELRELPGNVENLLEAAHKGELATIKDLLEKQHLRPGMVNKDGRSALYVAIEHGRADVVRLLLKYDAPEQLSQWTWNDSHFRRIEGKLVEYLEAARQDDDQKIQKLIQESGLGPDPSYISGMSAKDIAETHGCRNVLAEYHLSLNADVPWSWEWWRETYDERPLHTAARFGSVDVLREIFNHDQQRSIDRPCREWKLFFSEDMQGWRTEHCTSYRTPLFLAAQHGKHEAVQFLLERGARTYLPGFAIGPDDDRSYKYFKTALAAAVDFGDNRSLEQILSRAPDATSVLEHEDWKTGRRPLLQALSLGNTDGFEILLAYGANLRASPTRPVHPEWAAVSGTRENHHWNVIHYLASQGLCQTLQRHIVKFERSDFTDNAKSEGRWSSPRDLAKRNGHREIVRMIDERLKHLDVSSGAAPRKHRGLPSLFARR